MHGSRSPVSDVTTGERVVRRLHDITDQFRHMPVEQAAPQVIAHVRQFWEPRMRAALLAELPAPTGDDLIDAVLTAL